MFTISATEARAKQSTILDKASQGEAVRITRRIGGDVVVISAKEYQEWQAEKFDREFPQITGRFGDALKDLADK